MSEIKLVAESLNDFETKEEELFEGLNRKQRAQVIELAKDELTAEKIEANKKLLGSLINAFSAAVPGKAADMAQAKKKQLLAKLSELPQHVAPFLKVYAAKASGKKGDLVYSWDPQQKSFKVRLGNMQPGNTGVGGRTWSQ